MHLKSTIKEIPKALIVAIKTPKVSLEESENSIEELYRLVKTLGFHILCTERQNMASTSGATAVGAGKLKELAKITGAIESELEPDQIANLVIFDCDLTPSQLRHIESELQVEVMDRTGIIIEIFSRHAKTRMAKLQIEIARLNYMSPRLRETGSSGERQQGRGSGESALETERRAIRDRLAELKNELFKVMKEQSVNRNKRTQKSVALVGYTNAGKSSTMRALTGSEVYVQDKLFATLDTTVRALKPETKPRILISDTVGFIQKLPHDLVASFRSTLDEALNASLLLYVVDGADPNFREQIEVVENVLLEVGVLNTPILLVLNKMDLVDNFTKKRLAREFPKAIQFSSQNKDDVKKLKRKIIDFFAEKMKTVKIFSSYTEGSLVGEIRKKFEVLSETHEEDGTWFTVRGEEKELTSWAKKYPKSV